MKKLIFLLIIFAFSLTACAQEQNYETFEASASSDNNIVIDFNNISAEKPNVVAFKRDYLVNANIITQKKLKLKANDKRSGVKIGCIYKGKLFWSGVKYLNKKYIVYLFKCDKDFSNITFKELKSSERNVLFVSYIKNNY